MRGWLLLLAAVGVGPLAGPALADGDRCEEVHNLATLVMSGRQSGVEMPQMMAAARDSADGIRPILEVMVNEAYERPRYQTERMQNRATTDFANEWARICYGTME